jgi:hypothetical protein
MAEGSEKDAAFGRRAIYERAGVAAFSDSGRGVETQAGLCLFAAMAGVASCRKDGADLGFEVLDVCGLAAEDGGESEEDGES